MTLSRPSDKTAVTDKGKYLTVFEKQPDGSWKAVADMISSDMPVQSQRPKPKTHPAARAHKRAHSR
jgi:hypothetical protein